MGRVLTLSISRLTPKFPGRTAVRLPILFRVLESQTVRVRIRFCHVIATRSPFLSPEKESTHLPLSTGGITELISGLEDELLATLVDYLIFAMNRDQELDDSPDQVFLNAL